MSKTSGFLYRSGFVTALVQQKTRALDKVAQESPDLVILDFGGEDDFMMAFPPPGVETFAETLIARFRTARREFYDKNDFARGYIPEMNPLLPPRNWRLITLSAALETNENRALINFMQASSLLSRLMLRAKARGGDQWNNRHP